jgi:membrane protease YdiL (CAAX protease family)
MRGILNLPIEQRAFAAFSIYLCVTLSKKFWMPALNGSTFWLADVACFVVLPLILFFTLNLQLRLNYKPSMRGKKNHGWGAVVFMGGLCFLAVWAVDMVTELVGWRIARQHPDLLPMVISYRSHIPESGALKALVIVYFALTAAIVEEYVFRGLLGAFIKNAVAFVALSTLTFAIVHWGGGFANVFGALFSGLILAIVYANTKDLRVVMLAHGFYWLKFLF